MEFHKLITQGYFSAPKIAHDSIYKKQDIPHCYSINNLMSVIFFSADISNFNTVGRIDKNCMLAGARVVLPVCDTGINVP